ncbi:MAG: hypothetical protein IJ079_10665 [Lachnospiraceae bacterium]|nr:hypothetical protein [Lachnospiraceae bacterium]MBR1567704.1 hypothetical protein [Lachnospiraceae bacterium]
MTTFLNSPLILQSLACTFGLLALACLLVIQSILLYFRRRSYIIANTFVVLLHIFYLSAIVILFNIYNPEQTGMSMSSWLQFYNHVPAVIYLIYAFFICILCVIIALWIQHLFMTQINTSSIQVAINNLSDGLCIYDTDGRPLLMNPIIGELSFWLTGTTFVNANHLYQVITTPQEKEPFRRMEFGNGITLILPNEEIWQFMHQPITRGGKTYYRLIAHNITRLYKESVTLTHKQNELRKVQERLSATLDAVEQTEHERESLKLKLQIHERFGQTILKGQQCLTEEEPDPALLTDALTQWKQTIHDFKNAFTDIDNQHSSHPTENLMRVARDLNCRIEITDQSGYNEDTLIDDASEAVFTAIREALYNAVRHANATRLYITVDRSKDGPAHYIITDNGTAKSKEIHEGGGLTSIRRELERIGGSLTVSGHQGVRLEITDGRL